MESMYVVLVASVMGSLGAIVLGLSARVGPPAPVSVTVQTRRIEEETAR
jgi:hypothetical protein